MSSVTSPSSVAFEHYHHVNTRLEIGDIAVVIVYFILIIIIGIYASCHANRGTVSGYFLAGRSMMWYTVGASIFVSNIGSEHFIGLAGSGAAGGIGVGAWENNAILLIQMLGFVFIPVYIASKIYTMPEYLARRFGGNRLRVYFASLSLVMYIFTKCSVNLYTGALFIQQSLGWDLYLSILLLLAVVGILTITGGLTAVIYTDTLQCTLMVIGAFILTVMGFSKIGGFNELFRRYPHAMTNETVPNTTCHVPNCEWNVMLRSPSDTQMPWPGFLLGQTPASIWYWCTDQVIVQRALAAKSLSHAQGASIMAAVIKILPFFIMVLPGMISRVLYPNEVACVIPEKCYEICQSYAGCSNIAYPRLVLGIMPVGMKGLMMAVMIAALMSDLDSIFNSASTLFTIDIWQRVRPKASVKEIMIVGRVFVCVMVGVAIAWVPVVKETQGGQVFLYIQEVSAYLAPPFAMVFLLGIFWTKCNEKGAFCGLMVGLLMGVCRLILVFVFPAPDRCGKEDTRPSILKDVQYMYFAILLSFVTVLVTVTVSYLYGPPEPKLLLRTTFWTRYDTRYEDDLALSGFFNHSDKTTQTVQYENAAFESSTDDINHRKDASSAVNDSLELSAVSANVQQSLVRSPSLAENPLFSPDITFMERLLNFICGIDHHGLGNELANKEAERQEEELSNLEQDPRAKLGLRIALVTVLLIGVFLFCFWSLWKYEPPGSTPNGYC